jgi:hypothetical protein
MYHRQIGYLIEVPRRSDPIVRFPRLSRIESVLAGGKSAVTDTYHDLPADDLSAYMFLTEGNRLSLLTVTSRDH